MLEAGYAYKRYAYKKTCILKGAAKIVTVVKSCCHILVLAVMITVRQSFSTVTNAVATVNNR